MLFGFLSKSQPIQRSFFKIPRIALGFLGFWPETEISFTLILRVVLNLLILSFGAFGESIFALLNVNQLTAAVDAFCPSATKLVTIIKLVILFVERKRFGDIVVKLRRLLETENTPQKLSDIKGMSSVSLNISFVVWFFGNLTNCFYALRPITGNIIEYSTGQNVTKVLPFRVAHAEIYSENNFIFAATFIILCYSGVVTVFGFGGVDGSLMGFCLHTASLFRAIQIDITVLLTDIKNEVATEEQNNIFIKRLQKIVVKHIEVIKLCEEFVSLFTVIILAHFLSASLVLCMSSINLILGTGVSALLYVCYNLAVLAQLFVYCAGGNYLLENSMKIGEAAYCSEWYKCNTRLQKMILMILVRTRKGVGVDVPFFSPSLAAYGTILSTAGSYIALLKTFL